MEILHSTTIFHYNNACGKLRYCSGMQLCLINPIATVVYYCVAEDIFSRYLLATISIKDNKAKSSALPVAKEVIMIL